MLSRRDLVGKLATGAAVVCAAGLAGNASASTRDEVSEPTKPWPAEDLAVGPPIGAPENATTLSAPAPWELVQPLALGSVVAHGWQVAGLSGAVDGSCVLTLQNANGRTHRVHLCANDGQPQGLVYTRHFDLVVMNGGQGELPTDEGLAQAVAEVAHVLAANEATPPGAVVAALLPHRERVQRFASAAQLR